jgi:bacterioferritin-associated ferredoxin
MYVCLCNALTEHHVRQAAMDGASRPSEIYRACGCAAQCGACTALMRQIADEVARPCGEAVLMAAE